MAKMKTSFDFLNNNFLHKTTNRFVSKNVQKVFKRFTEHILNIHCMFHLEQSIQETYFEYPLYVPFGTKYSRMDKVKFVEDSL